MILLIELENQNTKSKQIVKSKILAVQKLEQKSKNFTSKSDFSASKIGKDVYESLLYRPEDILQLIKA